MVFDILKKIKITGSRAVTERGKYALDAAENNPAVEGTLAYGIKQAGVKINRKKDITYGGYQAGVLGEPGYVNFARVRVLERYIDYPVKFTVYTRGSETAFDLFLMFGSYGHADPSVSSFRAVNYGASNMNGFYIAKNSTSVWDLYFCKSVGWDGICILEENNIITTNSMAATEITHPDILVAQLPEGALQAVVKNL